MNRPRPTLSLLAVGVGEPSETVPLGIASVAAAIEAAFGSGLSVVLVEGGAGEDGDRMAAKLLAGEPSIVGFSVYSWNRAKMGEVARTLRARGFDGALFAGGPEASADPFSLAADLDLCFVVVGEGEETSVDALRKLSPGGFARGEAPDLLMGMPGVALPGREAEFKRRSAPEALRLPSPWIGGQASGAGRDEVVWELSRGCAFHCTYCYEGRGENGVRAFPRDRIAAELEIFVRDGVRRVFVLDPTFNWKRERALDLLGLFAERGGDVAWKFEARAELLDKSLSRAFARLNASIQIGLQSANPEVLALVGRPGFDPDRFAAKVSLLDAEGVTWGLDLIYGLPGDDIGGFRRSLDYALGLSPNHLDLFPLTVLPGTELAERAHEFGFVVEGAAPHLLLDSPHFPAADLAEAGDIARACDLFYTKGRAVSWFLRALAPLRVRPSTFLGRLAKWLGPEPLKAGRDSEAIEKIQLAFIEEEYRGRDLDRLLPLLKDIVRFEGAWGRAIGEGKTGIVELSTEAGFVVDPPCWDLRELAKRARTRPSRLRVSPGREGPKISTVT